jgi:hypothetical protein
MTCHEHNELISEICTRGDLGSLARLFAERTRDWPYFMRHVEGGTVGSFDDLESKIEADAAFRLIAKAAQIALRQRSDDLRETALSLAVGLARRSNTTEIPQDLEPLIDPLKQSAAGSLHLRILLEW